MKYYSHLTEIARYQIFVLHKSWLSYIFIAKQLARYLSTISHELNRNTGLRGYRPKQANALAQARKFNQNYRLFYWAYA